MENQERKKGQNHQSKQLEAVRDKLRQRRMMAKKFSGAYEENVNANAPMEWSSLEMIDCRCFIGYFVAYGVFNLFYWVDMLYY